MGYSLLVTGFMITILSTFATHRSHVPCFIMTRIWEEMENTKNVTVSNSIVFLPFHHRFPLQGVKFDIQKVQEVSRCMDNIVEEQLALGKGRQDLRIRCSK